MTAILKLKLRALNLGQGDNQTIVIKIHPKSHLNFVAPLDPTINGLMKLVIKMIEADAAESGMILKPLECWGSTSVYIYNKVIYLLGRENESHI